MILSLLCCFYNIGFSQENTQNNLLKLEILNGTIVDIKYAESNNDNNIIIKNNIEEPEIISSFEEIAETTQSVRFELAYPDTFIEKEQLLDDIYEVSEEIFDKDNVFELDADNDQNKNDNILPYDDPDGWEIIMSQTFEGSFPASGWKAYADSGYVNAFWDDITYRDYQGSYSAWCADKGSSSSSAGSNYKNNMKAWMIYGPFSLKNTNNALLDFYYWNKSESNHDYFSWYASINGRNFYGYKVSGNSGGWKKQTLDLTNVYTLGNLTGKSQVWIGFLFKSDSKVIQKLLMKVHI